MAMSQQSLPPMNKYTGSFTEDTEGDGVRLNAFAHEDVDVAFDPLSANRRFSGTADLAVLGTLVFAGPTRETISVMVPDCIVPPENGTVRVDLRHHVGLSLGPAVDMTNWSPEDHLERSLCPASLADTLGLQRRAYWDELNPILKQWKSVNNSNCPDCQKFIKINMGRHIRLKHSTYMCFWRCPVVSCSLWFTAELNAKDHIEGIHKFKEGHGTSFYECLRRHGIEWFGSRKFFEQRKETNQAIWMDMEGWFGREGQPPGPSVTVTRLTQVGVIIRLGNDRKMTLMDPDGPRMRMASQAWGVSLPDRAPAMVDKNSNLDPLWRPEWDGSHQAPLGRFVKAPRRRMRPAGNSGSARRVTPGRGTDAMRRSAIQPLSVEAVGFSPALAPEQNLLSGRKTMSSGAGGVVPTVVAEPPPPTYHVGLGERRGQVNSPSQWATRCL